MNTISNKFLSLSFIFSFLILVSSEAQNHWAQKVWGAGADMGFGITSDNQGNIYNTGVYAGDGHFGNITIPNPLFQYECYIAKFNQEGVALWANHAGGPGIGGTQSNAVFVDSQYNVYITGYFDSTSTFGSTTISANGVTDIFIAKLDSSGNFLWTMRAGGPGRDNGSGISVDANGNIFITGYFSDSCDFGGTILTSNGNRDLFIAKYNNSGNLLWVRSGGSNDDPVGYGRDEGTGVINDLAGNAYISGLFIDTAYFASDTLISTGSYDALIAKYNSAGVLQWINYGGGPKW